MLAFGKTSVRVLGERDSVEGEMAPRKMRAHHSGRFGK